MFQLNKVLKIGEQVDLYTLLSNDCEIENGIRGFMNTLIITYGHEFAIVKVGIDNRIKHITYHNTKGVY